MNRRDILKVAGIGLFGAFLPVHVTKKPDPHVTAENMFLVQTSDGPKWKRLPSSGKPLTGETALNINTGKVEIFDGNKWLTI